MSAYFPLSAAPPEAAHLDIDAVYELVDGTAVVTPDGVGRHFYDSLGEALAQHGPTSVFRQVGPGAWLRLGVMS